MLQNFSFKSRARVSSDKKAYLVDTGFYSSMKAGAQDDYGRLLENLIFVDILRKGLKPNLDLFYYKTLSGKEVDFLILENGKPSKLIQVAWNIGSPKTLERELSALVEASKELSIKDLTIITLEERSVHNIGSLRIRAIPAVEYFKKDK
jgi:predicted AAA+ superfamily ATPase